jgi:aminomethyltransferase
MVEFAGWVLPVHYPLGPNGEHQRVRQAAGLFDIDHMGQVVVSGPDALPFLDRVMSADVSRFEVGSAHYALMCYHDGTVVDDTFIYRLEANRYFVAINASNNAKDTLWLNYLKAPREKVIIENVSEATYMLALQGPRAEQILAPLVEADLTHVRFHHAVETRLLTSPPVSLLIGRTGYTGEDGFELFLPTQQAGLVWDAIMEAGKPFGLAPIGLAARDSLRFEPCLPLYGQEISASITPLEAGLGWACALSKSFVGREALLKVRLEGATRTLVGFEMLQGGVARHGYKVVLDGAVGGLVTSGMYAPTLDKFLGLAYIPIERAAVGSEINIQIRDKLKPAVIVVRPFYQPSYRRPASGLQTSVSVTR